MILFSVASKIQIVFQLKDIEKIIRMGCNSAVVCSHCKVGSKALRSYLSLVLGHGGGSISRITLFRPQIESDSGHSVELGDGISMAGGVDGLAE